MIQPFHFQLQKVSSKHLQVVDGLLEYLPATAVRETLAVSIRKALHQYLSDIGYYIKKIDAITFQDFFSDLPNPCSVAVIGMEPFKQKGFIEIDPFLSHLVIEKLLGGMGEDFSELKPLTETEQGVVEFLLLKLFAQLHKLSGEKERFHFRLEQMILESSQLRPFDPGKQEMVCLTVHVSLLGRSGFVKILLPHPWVLEGFLKEPLQSGASSSFQDLKNEIEEYAEMTVDGWSALGSLSVPYKDFKSLEEGDVVLLDETRLSSAGGKWKGDVTFHIGKGEAGGFSASWDGFDARGTIALKRPLKGIPVGGQGGKRK